MPTLNEYADEDGYYILARPSDTGNITYQLKPRGEQIVEKVGYQDGEDIGWQVINALKVPNLVYTGDEGTADDTSVDLDKEEIDALSEEDAKQLLDELSSVPRVGDSQKGEIRKILDISHTSKPDTDKLAAVIESSLLQQGIINERIPQTVGKYEHFQNGISVVAVDIRDTEEGNRRELHFEILILGELGNQFDGEVFKMEIGIRQDDGIVSFVTKADGSITVGLVTEYQKFMSESLPIIVSGLESVGINPGSPESLPGLKVTSKD